MRWYDSYCECVSRYIRDHTRLARGPRAIARIRGAIDDARRRERARGVENARARAMAPKANALAARIKRLMQKDDDVGKIAGAAPIVLAKALELFVKQLTTTTADVAALHGAKIVNASHLKGAVETVPQQFDFLSDLVEDAADLPPPPDLNELERELKEKAEAPAGGKRGGKRARSGKNANTSGDLGDLGDLGGTTTEARSRAKPKPKAPRRRAKKKVEDDFIDDEEEENFGGDVSETEDEFDPDEVVEPRARSTRSRRGVARKTYRDDLDEDFEDDDVDAAPSKRRAKREEDIAVEEVKEEVEAANGGDLGGFSSLADDMFAAGSLTADVGADEDDYD